MISSHLTIALIMRGAGRDLLLAAAEIAASNKRSGQNITLQDFQIAGIAQAKGAMIATRNVRDFTYPTIEVINPWDDQ